jgi:ankyrin repeat protein
MRAPQDGDTPLLNAAWKGHFEVVQLLVQANADMNFKRLVIEGKGCWAHKRCLCFSLGVAARPLAASLLVRVGLSCALANERESL